VGPQTLKLAPCSSLGLSFSEPTWGQVGKLALPTPRPMNEPLRFVEFRDDPRGVMGPITAANGEAVGIVRDHWKEISLGRSLRW
jgi:hypothetical protein